MEINQANLKALIDFKKAEEKVLASITSAVGGPALTRWLTWYAAWNQPFGAGVASLAGKMARNTFAFRDPKEPIDAIADRSVIIASYIFDAARDEFNDHTLPHRATHRCLAQAMVGTLIKKVFDGFTPGQINVFLQEPTWLQRLEDGVAKGYQTHEMDGLEEIFRGLGFHLGSELLADMEFSIIDSYMHDKFEDLTTYLNSNTYLIGKHRQNSYKWLAIHSGHGGGVEADHFLWATKSAARGLEFVDPALHDQCGEWLKEGFLRFTRDHSRFFEEATVHA